MRPKRSADQQSRVQLADLRVAAWARWQRSSGVHVGYPPESSFARVMQPADEEEQAGARHLSPEATDDEAMQVDRILARWRIHYRRRFRLIKTEFLWYASAQEKARRHGLKRDAYRERITKILGCMADELNIV